MSDTPETDKRVKDNKHIRFLEEDHWSLNGKFTYTHPIVALCRRLERERDEYRGLLIELYNDINVVHSGKAVSKLNKLFRDENYN
jgi:DNA/RNA-binding domain of Phe-tRNA-synthetase-like protein